MGRVRRKSASRGRARRGQRVAVATVALALCAAVGLVIKELYLARRAPNMATGGAAPDEAAPPAPAWDAPSRARPSVAPAPILVETPPWEATRENTPPRPGFTPAWQVSPPRPDPRAPRPPDPVPPPDPTRTRPPMQNPGGVDGDRPPRAVPGL